MLTVGAAARLLQSASTIERCASIAAYAGCAGAPECLDADLRARLGITAARAAIAAGPGALRALLLEIEGGCTLADELRRLARRLTTRAAHVLWLVVAAQPSSGCVAIGVWTVGARGPRVAALVVDRSRVVDSDGETLALLAAAHDPRDDADILTHLRWTEVLGREALSRRFYQVLERRVDGLAASLVGVREPAGRELALLCASRLLFLAFLEAKGWLNGDRDFLVHGFDACMASGGQYHRRVLRPLFFGTLNTRLGARAPVARAFGHVPFLNGGLFTPTHAERRAAGASFTDEALGAVYAELFARFRFTASEERTGWVEAAIDPEMLGRAFESLMSTGARRTSGTFYTPFALVERVTAAGFEHALEIPAHDGTPGTTPSPHARAALLARASRVTILDPACGSGAFLVHALERLAALRREAGDPRAPGALHRDVLTRSIFGVDRNPTAVWLCQLRLWLSIVIALDVTDPRRVVPLPNLDRNIRVGDSLADEESSPPAAGIVAKRLRSIRDRYVRATGPRKATLGRHLDREERTLAIARIDASRSLVIAMRRDLLSALRRRDLFGDRHRVTPAEREQGQRLRARLRALQGERRRLAAGGALPFSFATHFADVIAGGGFTIIVGNPPWVRTQRIPAAEREVLRRRFRVYQSAAWASGADRANAGSGFAGQADLASLFIERSVRLLSDVGTLALLVPVKLWHALAAGGVRRLLQDECRVLALEDFSDAPAAFDAAVYPSLLCAERRAGDDASSSSRRLLVAAAHRRGTRACWMQAGNHLGYDRSPGSPWLVMPAEVRTAFDRIAACGRAFADSPLGRPHLGVKTGYNLAFVVRRTALDSRAGPSTDVVDVVAANGRRGCVDGSLLRPVLRGESLRAWCAPAVEEEIVWTHDPSGAALASLPPTTARWLTAWRRTLAARTDARGHRWWSLFRVAAACADRPRVVWADIGRTPRATVLPAGSPIVPLNSCYAALCDDDDDALTLAALLNSPIAAAWLGALAEPARGGYRRFLGWTLALLPLPGDWTRARGILAPIAARAMTGGETPSADELVEASLAAYRLRHDDAAPLLAWLGD